MGQWVDVKAVLSIAYSYHKCFSMYWWDFKLGNAEGNPNVSDTTKCHIL
jgi:hypothetical protein